MDTNQQEAGGVCHEDQIKLVKVSLEIFFNFMKNKTNMGEREKAITFPTINSFDAQRS